MFKAIFSSEFSEDFKFKLKVTEAMENEADRNHHNVEEDAPEDEIQEMS